MPYKDALDRSAHLAKYRESHRDETRDKQRRRYHDNTAIGMLQDDAAVVMRAADYLKDWG
jgi:hypothetical protein